MDLAKGKTIDASFVKTSAGKVIAAVDHHTTTGSGAVGVEIASDGKFVDKNDRSSRSYRLNVVV